MTSPPTRAQYDSAHLGNVAAAVSGLKHPDHIGPYHIREVIGQGGMGTVYKAEQTEPIRRTVAVKVIKAGMDTAEVIARFESERQAVALMNHVNVARVLDAGATETGRPYFVMEYVAGEPITLFADRNRLTVRRRMELFIQACEGVEHAHQKGILHRDLKPSNILVTSQDSDTNGAGGLVKVIDFGLAKAIGKRLGDKTQLTEFGQLMGTPAYMSPEQADMYAVDIDTRADVYALGVVLYELLSGMLPLDTSSVRNGGYTEIQRIIREVDPPRPGTKLSRLGPAAEEIARCRQTPLRALERQLKGEIEWIPLKALRKVRAERYATATELAEDVRNYLYNRPLRAGPASVSYRARKFLRRNKGPVAAAALVAGALIGGVAGTSWQAVRATRAQKNLAAALGEVRQQKRQADNANASLRASDKNLSAALIEVRRQKKQAEDSAASAQAVNEFLTNDLLQSANPEVARGENRTVRQALDAASKTVEQKFKDQPLVEASVRSTLAVTYDALGSADVGLPHAQRALAIRRRVLGNDASETVDAINGVVNLLEGLAKLDEAEPLCREAVQRARPHSAEKPRLLIIALSNMARLLRDQGKPGDAEPFCRQAMEESRRAFGNNSADTLTAINNIACLLQSVGRDAQAEPLFRELVAAQRRLLGDDHPNTLTGIANLARALETLGKLDEAEALHREAIESMKRVLGEDHPSTVLEIGNLGAVYEARGRLEEAEKLYRQSLAATRKRLGDDHPDAVAATTRLSHVLQMRGRLDEAVELDRDVLARCRRLIGDDHPFTIGALNNLGMALSAQEKFREAEPLFAEAYRRTPGSQFDPVNQAACMARWGPCLVKLGRYEEAEKPLLEARRRLAEAGMGRSGPMRDVLGALVNLCEKTNRPDEAEKWRAELAATGPASRPR
jgi:serine/threonine protein kinase